VAESGLETEVAEGRVPNTIESEPTHFLIDVVSSKKETGEGWRSPGAEANANAPGIFLGQNDKAQDTTTQHTKQNCMVHNLVFQISLYDR